MGSDARNVHDNGSLLLLLVLAGDAVFQHHCCAEQLQEVTVFLRIYAGAGRRLQGSSIRRNRYIIFSIVQLEPSALRGQQGWRISKCGIDLRAKLTKNPQFHGSNIAARSLDGVRGCH